MSEKSIINSEAVDQTLLLFQNAEKSPQSRLALGLETVGEMSDFLGLFWGYFCLFLAVFRHEKRSCNFVATP